MALRTLYCLRPAEFTGFSHASKIALRLPCSGKPFPRTGLWFNKKFFMANAIIEQEAGMYKNILVPLDGSLRAESILPHVESIAVFDAP